MKTPNLVNVKLTALIGKNVAGLTAQVTNPRYFESGAEEKWRKLLKVKTHHEKSRSTGENIQWVQLYWENRGDVSAMTGCTVKSDVCMIQFTPQEYEKLSMGDKTKNFNKSTIAERLSDPLVEMK